MQLCRDCKHIVLEDKLNGPDQLKYARCGSSEDSINPVTGENEGGAYCKVKRNGKRPCMDYISKED